MGGLTVNSFISSMRQDALSKIFKLSKAKIKHQYINNPTTELLATYLSVDKSEGPPFELQQVARRMVEGRGSQNWWRVGGVECMQQ